jgi:hypothetical protein
MFIHNSEIYFFLLLFQICYHTFYMIFISCKIIRWSLVMSIPCSGWKPTVCMLQLILREDGWVCSVHVMTFTFDSSFKNSVRLYRMSLI